jgi:hypothetical protein
MSEIGVTLWNMNAATAKWIATSKPAVRVRSPSASSAPPTTSATIASTAKRAGAGKAAREEGIAGDSCADSSIRRGLEIGLIVLVVLLVILGIIIGLSKLKGGEEDDDMKSQTYY